MKNKELIIGILVGLLASAIGLLLTLFIFGKGNSVGDSLHIAIRNGVLTKLVSMGAILNLGAFFLFLKQKKDLRARGVLIATIVVAVITLIIRFV
ncbi:hypothetical protein [Psychroserpens algicola]|uniref:Uncharacterized protein n=1 Tax=Psychroserpens algicola TaxID=1719034 RepID=A0ABT0H823_9FLAO|nr:hypothetical protein [Psychroserpens algicola]MCK8480508.1 hypothetical protein [Psychroserpens algicola]